MTVSNLSERLRTCQKSVVLRQTGITFITSHVDATCTHSSDVIAFWAQRTERTAVARCDTKHRSNLISRLTQTHTHTHSTVLVLRGADQSAGVSWAKYANLEAIVVCARPKRDMKQQLKQVKANLSHVNSLGWLWLNATWFGCCFQSYLKSACRMETLTQYRI